MKILITGATGLIGSEIVRLCHEKNMQVNFLTTRKSKIVSKSNYQGFYWNPDTGEIDLNCFKDVSAIINLAGASISKRWSANYKNTILSSRVNALRTLKKGLDQVNNGAIESFVSASAIGIYPNSLSNFYAEDEKRIGNNFLGEVVEAWEKEMAIFEKAKLSVAKIRVGLVLSTKGGALPEMAKPIQYYTGAAFGHGKQWQSWIHITDLARQFLYVIEHQLKGVYNGVAPNPVNNSKLVKKIAKVLHKPLFLPNIPQCVMKLILGEMSQLLFASQRVSSKKIEEEGFVFYYPNVCLALENLLLKETSKSEYNSVSKKGYV